MEQLASIQKIAEIAEIPNADRIVAYRINGWWVVDRKGEYQVGDLVVYCEIDSWIPHAVAPFLSKGNAPRVFKDVPGERLRSVKLRGVVSQGLILPYSVCKGDPLLHEEVTEQLGIIKWEKPLDPQLQGAARGNFPPFIPKTDQTRAQTLMGEIFADLDRRYQVTIKLDGSSFTKYQKAGYYGVCSRNLDLKMDQADNTFIATTKDIIPPEDTAIQGELMGPKIQGNRERFNEFKCFVFDIFNIRTQSYWSPDLTEYFCTTNNYPHVPVLYPDISLRELGIKDMNGLLEFAEGKSINNSVREGIVFKELNSDFSFKVISNKFLLGEC